MQQIFKLVYRAHALKRMAQRDISPDDIECALRDAEIIESYPDDTPYPSNLVIGWSGKRPMHIVVANNIPEKESIVVTVYEPDTVLWHSDFKRRKT